MNAVVSLAPGQADKKLTVGEETTVQVLIDEKIGAVADKWTLPKAGEKRWLQSGGIAADAGSLKGLPTDGAFTKLEFRAIVTGKGEIGVGEMTVRHEPSGREFSLSGQLSQGAGLYKEGAEQVPWTLPTLPIGGWNYWAIGGLAFLSLIVAFFAIRFALNRAGLNPLAHVPDPKEKALQDLEALRQYGKKKGEIKLEDWKKFSFELAGILRRYSDANFGIASLDLTDREFLSELGRNARGAKFVKPVAAILSLIDEVRYGTKELEQSLVPTLIDSASAYVKESFHVPPKEEGKTAK